MLMPEERKHLIDNLNRLLDEYGYKHTDEALNQIVDEWYAQKKILIDAFRKHPNYVDGQFAISFTKEIERSLNAGGSKEFKNWLLDNCMRNISIQRQNILDRRTGDGDYCLPWGIWNFFVNLSQYAERCLSKNTVEVLEKAIPEVKVHVGEKTTRAINRICSYLGWDKVEGYNKAFAKYSDSLATGTIKRRVVLSLNPLDYLTMSFGNSWSSCHTIDKNNKRSMPNGYEGMYSSGTMSYMLDQSSMILYAIDPKEDTEEYWQKPKINRQMFHWGKGKLVQGRLYPQNSDDNNNEYSFYRDIVKDIFAEIFNLSGNWKTETGHNAATRYIVSDGTHYPDYMHFSNCSLSYCDELNADKFTVGARPICVRCGKRHTDTEHIDCCVIRYCKKCGRLIREDDEDAHEINGEFYCHRCCFRCDICGSYHVGGGTRIRSENITVCDDCRNEHFVRCEDCYTFVRKDSLISHNESLLCDDCYQWHTRPRRYSYSTYWNNSHMDWLNDL